MAKQSGQDYKVEEINKPTPKESEQRIKDLCEFLEKTWDMEVKTT